MEKVVCGFGCAAYGSVFHANSNTAGSHQEHDHLESQGK